MHLGALNFFAYCHGLISETDSSAISPTLHKIRSALFRHWIQDAFAYLCQDGIQLDL